MTHKCWDYVRILFDVICEVIGLILRQRSPAPARQFYEDWTNCILCMYKMTWLMCILWGNSLLRCAGSFREAGASYVNK